MCCRRGGASALGDGGGWGGYGERWAVDVLGAELDYHDCLSCGDEVGVDIVMVLRDGDYCQFSVSNKGKWWIGGERGRVRTSRCKGHVILFV
jgi:ligand-binding sensor domain-containing protein